MIREDNEYSYRCPLGFADLGGLDWPAAEKT